MAGTTDAPEKDDDDRPHDLLGAPGAGVAAIALLVIAVAGSYFGIQRYRADRAISRAERALSEGHLDEAVRHLQAAPDNDKTRPLKEAAAFALASQARDRFARGELRDAEAQLERAAQLYPGAEPIRSSLEAVQASLAFQQKDYARFLSVAEAAARRRPDSAVALGTLASALATQYAVTGDDALRVRAVDTLEQARKAAERSPEAQQQYDEYAPRIRHRLETREIIDRLEYDRRFRTTPAPARK
jgi:tetratricopeptide (TPR) repeat protein